uniref:Uncharacterized protein n=1 Tax=Gopherus evgoodei TaxID=1825980 RepID=A0A8C4VJJ6_9SAUR
MTSEGPGARKDPRLGPQKPWRRSWDAPTSDPRVRLLGERVVRSLRLKLEGWERYAGSPEVQPLLWGSVESAAGQPSLLLVTLSPAGQLALSTEFPTSPGRGKALFFLCRGPGPLSAPPSPRELLYRDLPASSLEHFAALVEEVRGPRLLRDNNAKLEHTQHSVTPCILVHQPHTSLFPDTIHSQRKAALLIHIHRPPRYP